MADLPYDRSRNDPYLTGQAPANWDHPHVAPETRVVAADDGWGLDGPVETTPYNTRAVIKGEVLRLILTDDPDARPRATIAKARPFAFVEVVTAGILVKDDGMAWKGAAVGAIAAFDERTQPNHLTVVIRNPAGPARGDRPVLGDTVAFEARFTPFA